ncbi:DUF3883 domain-containing protein [Bremerella alba]|uniref:Protein NO VEIN C-terminal domain-containing protein n=1 Tax=Bremerella alba TaxID=980252 RepID=A0A7V9A8W5_9BACT|nr:DUF3883 domain-containing protein [Bremerella alba]MBA2116723.1 hypothetical protein [Bremerella alba]
MTQYWCANFYSEECLSYGITHDLWMMQYQYEDSNGNEFEKYTTTQNWNRLPKIQHGDWLIAYLPQKRSRTKHSFFAIGKIRFPRRPATSENHVSTISDYVSAKLSHEYTSGVVHYKDASVFYEDFNDSWRRSDDPLKRHAQRIDVEKWLYCSAKGVPWPDDLFIPVNEIQRVFFKIEKRYFDEISEQLRVSSGEETYQSKELSSLPNTLDSTLSEEIEIAHAKSQGFLLDSLLRRKIEDYSMRAAIEHYGSQGYDVEDHSKNHPYDLKCTRHQETLFIEVKGTQTDGRGVFLTNAEVEFAGQHPKQMALFIFHSIQVSSDGATLEHGEEVIIQPWIIDQTALTPISFKYDISTD